MRVRSNVSAEPFQTKRSSRFPSKGTSVPEFESTPDKVSLQNRYTNPFTMKFRWSAIPSKPRSEFELTARSRTGPSTTPLRMRITRPVAFSLTSMSFAPMNARPVGWLRPVATVRTARFGSTTVGS